MKASVTVNVDEYDIVFLDKNPKNKTLYTNVYGGERFKYKTKNKTVDIEFYGVGTHMSSEGLSYMTVFKIKPLKTGNDILTFSIDKQKLTLSVYVSPDAFISKDAPDNTSQEPDNATQEPDNILQKPDNTSQEPENASQEERAYLSKELSFWDIPWGSSYEETGETISKQSFARLSTLEKAENGLYTASVHSGIQFGNLNTNYAVFSFDCEEGNTQKTRLAQIELSGLILMPEYDLPELKNEMKKIYGEPILDEITGTWDIFSWKVGKKCVWEKGNRRLTLLTDVNHYVNLIFSEIEVGE